MATNEEFAEKVMQIASPNKEFSPTSYYDPDGDCIECLEKSGPFYAQRIGKTLTIYYSRETGEVVGSLLKGISRIIKGNKQ